MEQATATTATSTSVLPAFLSQMAQVIGDTIIAVGKAMPLFTVSVADAVLWGAQIVSLIFGLLLLCLGNPWFAAVLGIALIIKIAAHLLGY